MKQTASSFLKIVLSVVEKSTRTPIRRITLSVFLGLALIGGAVVSAPASFSSYELASVEDGMSITGVAHHFAEKELIRSPFLFRLLVSFFGDGRGVIAGDYYFEKPLSAVRIAYRVSNGVYGLSSIRVTIPEGATVYDIGAILSEQLPEFNQEKFLDLARDKEGFLFPDTYFFLPNSSPSEIIAALEHNFDQKIQSVFEEIQDSQWTLEEILVMASILEKEAREYDTKRMISGILWKRIEIGMPLQVDAVFPYILGKNTFELTYDDLAFDSPYNTYQYTGLPPGPIANPGIDSIQAALRPESSEYLFYLSDLSGAMHYAVTHDVHVQNKARYLR